MCIPFSKSKLFFAAVLAATVTGAFSAEPDPRLKDAFGKLPMQFEENLGQSAASVRYLARGGGYSLFLTANEAVLSLRRGNGKDSSGADLRMRLTGANPQPKLIPEKPLIGKVNYLHGSESKNWHAGVGTWEKVRYSEVYPGIDLVFYGNQGQLEFDFVAAPGADVSQVRFRVDGAQAKVDAQGDLILTAGGESITMRKPVVYQGLYQGLYQSEGAVHTPVAGRFTVNAAQEIAFALGQYDPKRTLVIDPSLAYASYLGGSQENFITGLAVNAAGEAFVTGYTIAPNFPTTAGVVQRLQPMCAPGVCSSVGAPNDAFVAHISADGTQLLYSTYLGGNNEDEGRAIAVDGAGDAYVTGYTFSNDFPVVNPYQATCNACESHPNGQPLVYTQGAPDVFITKLNPTGSAILYSTFFGGTGNDNPNGIALDAQGNIYIAGSTSSVYTPAGAVAPNIPFPVTASAYQDGKHGTQNQNYFVAFVSKFSADGQTLLYSTTFGGPAAGSTIAEGTRSMGIGQNGFVAIGGTVTSPSMPTRNAIQSSCSVVPGGTFCLASFLAAFDTTKSGDPSLLFATYLGGAVPAGAASYVNGIAVDAQNNLYATGTTQAHDFPATSGTLFPGCSTSDVTRNCNDAFVLKVNATGGLTWATNFGNGVPNCPQVSGYALTTDSTSNVYVAGNLGGCGLAAKGSVSPIQAVLGFNAFVVELNPTASSVLFGTPFGGNLDDIPYGIALDAKSNIYIAGSTTSTSQLSTPGVFQPTYAGGPRNGFVAKISTSKIYDPTFFVNQQYLDLLGRPGDASGLQYWSALLTAGMISRSQMADGFFTSTEFSQTGGLVIAAYIAVLGRDPDFTGWLFWLNNLRAGTNAVTMFNSFVTSTEFQTAYGSLDNSAFVNRVYLNVLGRPADSGGLSYWAGLLNTGALTRAQLMYNFATSTEFNTANQNRSLAILLYMGFLRRSPEPAGEAYWIGVLNAGAPRTGVLNTFITSTEYLARF